MPGITSMPFGSSGSLDSVSVSRSYGELDIPHGAERYSFFLETEIGITTEDQVCGSAGIAVNQSLGSGGSGNLTSVGLTEEEVVAGPKKVPVTPGISLELQSGRLLKALESCFMILGYNHAVALAGRGVPILTGSEQGSQPGQKTFASASGVYSIVSHAEAVVKALNETQPPSAPFTWTAELGCYVNNSVPTSHILSLPAAVSALIPSNTIYVIAHSVTMTEMPNNPTESYTVTCHPTT